MTDTLARRIARLFIDAALLVCLSPILLAVAVASGLHTAWRRFELWAYYGGDEAARTKDEWRRR